MKNQILLITSVAMISIVSCKQPEGQNTEKTVIIEKSTENEIIKTPETPVNPVTPVTPEAEGTTLNIDKDGVEFSSKNGEKKTQIDVNENGAAVSTK